MWQAICRPTPFVPPLDMLPVIGCDLAAHGDDSTEMHIRWAGHSLHHERHQGWLEDQTAGRLKQLCQEWAARVNEIRDRNAEPVRPEELPTHFDGDGRGGALITHAGGYNFRPICASSVAIDPLLFPNRRSELWFSTVNQARKGKVNVSLLPPAIRAHLQTQLMAPTWKVNAAGECEVERKDDTKKLLGASPDAADAFNLAYAAAAPSAIPSSIPNAARPKRGPDAGSRRDREPRNWFGRH